MQQTRQPQSNGEFSASRRDPTLQLTTSHLWNLPLIGLERLLRPPSNWRKHSTVPPQRYPLAKIRLAIVISDEKRQVPSTLCRRKSLRKLLIELLPPQEQPREELHLLVGQLYGNGRDNLNPDSPFQFAT